MGKVNIRKVKCVICRDEITVWTEVLTRTKKFSNQTESQNLQGSFSDEGFFFPTKEIGPGVWFCKSCWKKIIKKKLNIHLGV